MVSVSCFGYFIIHLPLHFYRVKCDDNIKHQNCSYIEQYSNTNLQQYIYSYNHVYEFYALKVHTQTIEIPFIHCFGYNFRINIPKIWLKFIPINIIILASYILLFHSEIQSIYFNYNPNTCHKHFLNLSSS
jgi:hypothetical protein